MKKIVIIGNHPTPAEAFMQIFPDDWQPVFLPSNNSPRFYRYDWRATLAGLTRIPQAILKARQQLKTVKADLVVSFGGYASVPVCWAARSLGVPIVIHEQTFAVGLAVKLTAPVANKVAISWRSSQKYLPSGKLVLTGNPIRGEIISIKRAPKAWLYITGGRQGSAAINAAVAPLLPKLTQQFSRVYHQYGLDKMPNFKHPNYYPQKYFNLPKLKLIYTHARAVVGRAGINTVTELGYLRLPSVLIPLPFTQVGEQENNARYLSAQYLAVVIPQDNLSTESLMAALAAVLALPADSPNYKFPRHRVASAAKNLKQVCTNLLPR